MADGDQVKDLLPADDRIRLIHLAGRLEIGDKRNFGCERATGEIIALFDDDDHSAPGRLADQVARLQDTGKPVTGYRTMKFTDGSKWWMYRGAPDYAVGTSLCFRRDWWESNRFPSKQIQEDVDFVNHAIARRSITSVECPDLMYATIHPGNTSERSVKGHNWVAL